jgi:hypothetical protein
MANRPTWRWAAAAAATAAEWTGREGGGGAHKRNVQLQVAATPAAMRHRAYFHTQAACSMKCRRLARGVLKI